MMNQSIRKTKTKLMKERHKDMKARENKAKIRYKNT